MRAATDTRLDPRGVVPDLGAAEELNGEFTTNGSRFSTEEHHEACASRQHRRGRHALRGDRRPGGQHRARARDRRVGSISAGDFALQKNGYINALTALLPTDGSVAVGVWQFSGGVQLEFAMTEINSAAARTALLTALGAMTQLGNLTAIGDAINTAAAAINGNAITSHKQVIDVSTDGFSNTGADPTTAALNAIASGIEQVNGLGVGGSADLSWVPAGSLTFTATSFADFERAITEKLRTEIVPEPGTIALLGLGLLGLGGVVIRRRRS